MNCLPSDIPVCREGFTLLGCPVGCHMYCDKTVLARVSKIKEILDKLPDLEDTQMETTLLRSCLALPKLNFALRGTPPHYIPQSINTFDTIYEMAGGPLTDRAWLNYQALLVVSILD